MDRTTPLDDDATAAADVVYGEQRASRAASRKPPVTPQPLVMSFGFSPSDILNLLNLTTRAYEGWKDACGQHTDITASLHALTGHLSRGKKYFDKANISSFDTKEDLEQWKLLLASCTRVVSALNNIITKYEPVKSRRSNWHRLRLGWKNLGDLERKLNQRTTDIAAFFSITAAGALGRIEPQLEELVGNVPEIKATIQKLAQYSVRDASVMTHREGDDTHVWRRLRRTLLNKGVTSDTVSEYEAQVSAYLESLAREGILGMTVAGHQHAAQHVKSSNQGANDALDITKRPKSEQKIAPNSSREARVPAAQDPFTASNEARKEKPSTNDKSLSLLESIGHIHSKRGFHISLDHEPPRDQTTLPWRILESRHKLQSLTEESSSHPFRGSSSDNTRRRDRRPSKGAVEQWTQTNQWAQINAETADATTLNEEPAREGQHKREHESRVSASDRDYSEGTPHARATGIEAVGCFNSRSEELGETILMIGDPRHMYGHDGVLYCSRGIASVSRAPNGHTVLTKAEALPHVQISSNSEVPVSARTCSICKRSISPLDLTPSNPKDSEPITVLGTDEAWVSFDKSARDDLLQTLHRENGSSLPSTAATANIHDPQRPASLSAMKNASVPGSDTKSDDAAKDTSLRFAVPRNAPSLRPRNTLSPKSPRSKAQIRVNAKDRVDRGNSSSSSRPETDKVHTNASKHDKPMKCERQPFGESRDTSSESESPLLRNSYNRRDRPSRAKRPAVGESRDAPSETEDSPSDHSYDTYDTSSGSEDPPSTVKLGTPATAVAIGSLLFAAYRNMSKQKKR